MTRARALAARGLRLGVAVALAAAVACDDATPLGYVLGDAATDGAGDAATSDATDADAAVDQDSASDADDANPDASDSDTPDAADAPDEGDATDAHDAPDAADPGSDPEVDGTDADVDSDVDDAPFVCGEGTTPAWAALAGSTLTARCSTRSVAVTVYDDATLRLVTAAPGAAVDAPASRAVVATPALASAAGGGDATGAATVCSGDWRVVVDDRCRVRVYDGLGVERMRDADDAGAITATGVTLRREVPTGARFYGFGEHTGPLERTATQTTYWNTDAYDTTYGGWAPDADPMYMSLPFGMWLEGGVATGLFTDDSRRQRLELGDATLAVDVDTAGPVVQYMYGGPTPADVVRRYTAMTGRPSRPPLWALGFHQSRWGYQDAATVEAIAGELRARGFGADALTLDIQHMDGFRTFTFDPLRFADPEGLAARLASLDFRLVAIADPGIKQDPGWDVYASGLAAGVYVMRGATPYVGVVWPGDAVFVDFALGRGRDWWAARVAELAGRGVAGVWLDVNEPTNFPEGGSGLSVPNELAVGEVDRGETMASVHNVYGMLEAQATVEGLRAARPDERPFVFSRAGYAGIQRSAATWTGDVPSTWWALQMTLPMVLNMGLSGMPFVGSDVGGYSGNASPELYARWVQLGAFTPYFRAHVTSGVPGQEPWMFGTETEDIAREVIALRYELMPYLYSLMVEASETGAPPLRPILWEFPTDASAAAIDDEAMFGPWLFVAPVLEEGATTRTVRLPPGRWVEWRSGRLEVGPATLEERVTRAGLPLYLREGAIIPTWPTVTSTAAGWPATLGLEVVEPPDAGSAFTVVIDDGQTERWRDGAVARLRVRTSRAGSTLTVDAATTGSLALPFDTVELRLRPYATAPAAVRLDGVPLPGDSWRFDEADQAIYVELAATRAWRLEVDGGPASETAPTVPIRFVVDVPPGTSAADTIHIAGEPTAWEHVPMTWEIPGARAAITLPVPRGAFFDYKYTRGGWETVEKWPGCAEAANRYGFGQAYPERADRVFEWRDWCE
ncbi:MAG: hypothetical protein H6700_08315 [Myxococcales bacterium]|nr:hypothetical protein [Myxococcales bacterium]